MPEGTINKLTDKGFGFISTEDGRDFFFHFSSVEGARFEELWVGQLVTFTPDIGPKGPRAVNVKPA